MKPIMLIFILWSGIAILSFGSAKSTPEPFTLVTDLLRFLKIPLKVTLFVCWPEERSAQFVRRLLAGPLVPFVQVSNGSVENVALLDAPEAHQQLAILDLECPGTGAFLAAAQYRIYHRVRWLLLGAHPHAVFDALASLHVTGCSEVYYFDAEHADGGTVSIRNAYRKSMHSGIISELIGVWRNGTVEDRRLGLTTSSRRRNLQQLPLRTSLIFTDNYTLSHFDDHERPEIDTPNRISYLIINSLTRFYLNATLEKRYATTWCYPDRKSGDLVGLCMHLINNQSEVGTFMFFNPTRIKLLEYMPIPMEISLVLYYKAPKLSIMSNIFRMPFDLEVWACLLALVMLIGVIMALISVLSAKHKRRAIFQARWGLFYDMIFETIPIALQQGSLIVPKRATHRMAVLFSVVGLMFLSVSYSAKVISLIQAPSERINSLRDLLESRIEVGGLDIAYNRFMLRIQTEPVRKAIYEQKIRQKDGSMNLYPLEKGMAKVQKGLFAFHVVGSSANAVISRTFDDTEKCYLRTLDFVGGSVIYLTVQKNFTFREHFRVGLVRVRESGVFSSDYQRFRMAYKPSCVKGIDFQPLDAVDLRFALGIIGGGLMATVVVLAGEIAWNRYRIAQVPQFEYVE